jgi:hypothetical protein
VGELIMSSKQELTRNMLQRHKAVMTEKANALVKILAVNLAPGGREALARALNLGIDAPDRQISVECGYPATLDIHNFRVMYDRHGLAQRANDCLPNECWKRHPLLYETNKERKTAFEKGWKTLTRTIPMWTIMHRADRLSGLGRYGIIVLGFDDCNSISQKPMSRPVDEARENKLVWAQVFPEDLAEVSQVDQSEFSPRCGHPTMYRVTVGETRAPGGQIVTHGKSVDVHWTRVVHVADGIDSSPIYGRERLRAVFDYLLDLRKVLGGSAEMFWKGAFPGFSLEMLPEYVGNPLDDELIKKEMDAYHNHLQRYLAFEGFKVNPIAPQVADPTPQVTQLINAICATLEIPVRIFMGSESGHLASTQDTGNFNGRVMGRRQLYVEPSIIRPTIDRLIQYKAIPSPRNADKDYIIEWPDLNTVSEKDRADIALKAAQTLMQYVTSGAEKVYPFSMFLTRFLSHTDEEKDALMSALKDNPLMTKELWEKVEGPQGGGRNGSAAGGRTAGSPTTAA